MQVQEVTKTRFRGSTCQLTDVVPADFTRVARLLEEVVGKELVAHVSSGTDQGTFAFTGRVPAAYNPCEETYFTYRFSRDQGSEGMYSLVVQGPAPIVTAWHEKLTKPLAQ